jgi:F-type H+-transporting ATPase subunit b
MEILAKLGIEPQFLIAQAVNFGLLLFILYKFAYQPILKMLNARTEKIEKSIAYAAEIETKLANTETETSKIIENAKVEAKKILAEAESASKETTKAMLAAAEAKASEIVARADENIQKEKEQIMTEVKENVSEIVASALTAIGLSHETEVDKKLIEEVTKK